MPPKSRAASAPQTPAPVRNPEAGDLFVHEEVIGVPIPLQLPGEAQRIVDQAPLHRARPELPIHPADVADVPSSFFTPEQLEAFGANLKLGDFITITWRSYPLFEAPGPFETWSGLVGSITMENGKRCPWVRYMQSRGSYFAFPPSSTTPALVIQVQACQNLGQNEFIRRPAPPEDGDLSPPRQFRRVDLGLQMPAPLMALAPAAVPVAGVPVPGTGQMPVPLMAPVPAAVPVAQGVAVPVQALVQPVANANGYAMIPAGTPQGQTPAVQQSTTATELHEVMMRFGHQPNNLTTVIRTVLQAREDQSRYLYKAFYMFHILKATNQEIPNIKDYMEMAMLRFQSQMTFLQCAMSVPQRDLYIAKVDAYVASIIAWRQTVGMDLSSKETYQQVFSNMSFVIYQIARIHKGERGETPIISMLQEQWRKGTIDVALILDEIFSTQPAAGDRTAGGSTRQHPRKGKRTYPAGSSVEKECRFCHAKVRIRFINGKPDWKDHNCTSKSH